jgi:hypothetical protein
MRPIVVALAFLSCIGCSGRKNDSSPPPPPAASNEPPTTATKVREAEKAAAEPVTECRRRVTIYKGSIEVNSVDYLQPVEVGDADVERSIPDLDRVISTASRIDFTLEYPFEKPFSGSITEDLTLRRIIDAVRKGFRHMYEGTTQRDIPKLENKDVTGPYGHAFHVISDLVIEQIDLCDGRSLDVSIGS